MIRSLAPLALGLALSLSAFASTPVDVNHADAATIAASLDGVGAAKAKAIVAYRKAHGPFKSADELARVKGIGKSTIEHNRRAIRVGGSK